MSSNMGLHVSSLSEDSIICSGLASSVQDWKKIVDDFSYHWNFPHCLGAIDGKHCNIQAPPNSGSEYFNYKKTFSVVLMAVSDALSRFVYVDVGTPGRWSDGGTFDHCNLNRVLSDGGLGLPPDTSLPGGDRIAPFTFVADEAFPLKTCIMRPFPSRANNADEDGLQKRIFNFRLSRARRTIENAFGIMVARWRCLRSPLHMSPNHATSVILACCVLHNFLRDLRCDNHCPPGFSDAMDMNGQVVQGAWRNDGIGAALRPVNPTAHHNPPVTTTQVRETFMSYFNEEGALPWQIAHVNRT